MGKDSNKKRILLKVGSCNYWLTCKENGSKSNYNMAVHVTQVRQKMPICGTTMKSTESLFSYKKWAIEQIEQFKNEIPPFNL